MEKQNSREWDSLDKIKKLFEPYCNYPSYKSLLEKSVDLRYPTIAPSTIQLEYLKDDLPSNWSHPWQNGHPLPFAASEVFEVELTSAKRLTNSEAVKDTWELEFSSLTGENVSTGSGSDARPEATHLSYMPGDAFGFLCPNLEKEVDDLLGRVACGTEQKHLPCIVNFLKPEKATKQFGYFPRGRTTLHNLFGTCIDIRGVLKKALLRQLAEYTTDGVEKNHLLFLSSRQGAQEYTKIILEQKMTILDLLTIFATCRPPPELLLAHLPRLQPRYYSASSWSEESATKCLFRIVYKRVFFPEQPWRTGTREGLCTGWLTKLAVDWLSRSKKGVDERLHCLSLDNSDERKDVVRVYLRKNLSFQFPTELDANLVMVGPGSGVAPFLCYLQWKEHELDRRSSTDENLVSKVGNAWLFFGCRYRDLDFLYKEELERLLKKGILSKLIMAFSRDAQRSVGESGLVVKYVQDSLRLHAEDVLRLIEKEGAHVFVCGDAKNMSADVRTAFCDVLCGGKVVGSTEEAESHLKMMQAEGRYLQDVWA